MASVFFNKINDKGQLSVEFILIILVVLILIEVIILPLRDYSEASMKDITNISYLESNMQKLQQAISDLNSYSEGKLEVKLHIPEDSNFYIHSYSLLYTDVWTYASYNQIIYSNDINVSDCNNNICQKDIFIGALGINAPDTFTSNKRTCTGSGHYINCVLIPISDSGYFFNGPLDQTIIMQKSSDGKITLYRS